MSAYTCPPWCASTPEKHAAEDAARPQDGIVFHFRETVVAVGTETAKVHVSQVYDIDEDRLEPEAIHVDTADEMSLDLANAVAVTLLGTVRRCNDDRVSNPTFLSPAFGTAVSA